MKLTKTALNKFIVWSSSRYNDYLGYGNKKENIEIIYNSLKNGFYTGWRGKQEPEKVKFTIECATGNGEGYGGRYWRLKGRLGKTSDYQYEIDCEAKTVTGLQSNTFIHFN
jgi:hypothetical protein